LVRHSRREDISIQPIYDCVVDRYVGQRTLLVGDSGTMTWPHTASGAPKALEELAVSCSSLPELLAAYDDQRCGAARTLSKIGQRIERAQVLETPDWGRMRAQDFEQWIAAILAGDTFYLFGEKETA